MPKLLVACKNQADILLALGFGLLGRMSKMK